MARVFPCSCKAGKETGRGEPSLFLSPKCMSRMALAACMLRGRVRDCDVRKATLSIAVSRWIKGLLWFVVVCAFLGSV